MNILFISKNLLAGNLAYLLKKEGHEVKLFIDKKESRGNFDYMVTKVTGWKSELSWVGKDGLIVFDDIGYGKIQDRLREKGYSVFGGSYKGELLESDREFGQKILHESGMQTVVLKDFKDMEDAAIFIKEHPDRWVIKQNNGNKMLNYVGSFEDGRDALSVLKNYLQNKKINREKITLQKRIDGVEIGIGRYFNGTDWVGPIELNIEHTELFPGNLGPTTSEMGTLAWYDDNESNVLFEKTLKKIKPYLKTTNYRGDIEINCIVNEKGIFPLEITARMGSPIVHLHSEFHQSPWGEFLKAVADGKQYDLKWKKGYGVVLLMAVPPFPYTIRNENLSYGINIFFKNDMTKDDLAHVHYEEVSSRGNNLSQLYISDKHGYILYTTGMGKTPTEARDAAQKIAKKIVIPKMFYRNDIGLDFEKTNLKKLKDWGYL